MDTGHIASLYYVRSRFALFVAVPTLAVSIVGELLTVVVFLSLKTFRESSCAFYLTFMSISNFVRLVFSTSFIVTSMGFTIDWTFMLVYYCQIRNLIVATCNMIAVTCLCLAVIDQYFATCPRPQWQRWANIRLARGLTALITGIWILHAIPYCIYFNQLSVSNTPVCISTNPILLRYHTYGYFLTFGNLLPFIAVIFGVLAFRNARTLTTRTVPLVRRELDKQLTVMVLVELGVYVCTYAPYSMTNGFSTLNTNRDPLFLAQLNLINAVTLTLSILSNGNSFYTYVAVSKRFRRQSKYVMYEAHINRCQRNRIVPETTRTQTTVVDPSWRPVNICMVESDISIKN